MKIKLIIAAGVIIALAASFTVASAQHFGESPVKILPTSEKGILKVLYASSTDKAVFVKFYNDRQEIASDKIKGSNYPNGFSKKYDVRKLKAESFWVEVSSPGLVVTYRMIPSNDGQSFEPLLEKTTYDHTLVAANN